MTFPELVTKRGEIPLPRTIFIMPYIVTPNCYRMSRQAKENPKPFHRLYGIFARNKTTGEIYAYISPGALYTKFAYLAELEEAQEVIQYLRRPKVKKGKKYKNLEFFMIRLTRKSPLPYGIEVDFNKRREYLRDEPGYSNVRFVPFRVMT